jgi:5-methyltetrahydropteroyltriglutamate--homocysteine methyltransferase
MGATQAGIKTTVVGSYPIPDGLAERLSEQALVGATRVVLSTQETAGIDLDWDGELYSFDANDPETNGMIYYFSRPLSGLGCKFTFDEILAFWATHGMEWRKKPTGIIEGPACAIERT